jgi:hypothetical protein
MAARRNGIAVLLAAALSTPPGAAGWPTRSPRARSRWLRSEKALPQRARCFQGQSRPRRYPASEARPCSASGVQGRSRRAAGLAARGARRGMARARHGDVLRAVRQAQALERRSLGERPCSGCVPRPVNREPPGSGRSRALPLEHREGPHFLDHSRFTRVRNFSRPLTRRPVFPVPTARY